MIKINKKVQVRLISLVLSVMILLGALFVPQSALAEDDTEGILLKRGSEGDDVIMLQLRLKDLGYYNYKITNYFGSFTENALKEFQKENGLKQDGVVGEDTYGIVYSNSAVRKPIMETVKPTPPPKYVGSSSIPQANLRDWFSYVLPRFDRGEKVKVYDVATGISYYMVRVGGSNHADVEPATAADCDKFKTTYGGVWSWDRRAVVVRIDGEYIAASTNGYPHGYETVGGNDMNGQVCIHFLNSKTHNNNAMCPEHQAMVKKAYDVTN